MSEADERRERLALITNPHTPRHVSLPLVRQLRTFELMDLALTPAVLADIKLLAEECLLARLDNLSAGERLTLAKRASTRVAAALLFDDDIRVIQAALNNPYLTESYVVRALRRCGAESALGAAVGRHRKWSLRRDVRQVLEPDDGVEDDPAEDGRTSS